MFVSLVAFSILVFKVLYISNCKTYFLCTLVCVGFEYRWKWILKFARETGKSRLSFLLQISKKVLVDYYYLPFTSSISVGKTFSKLQKKSKEKRYVPYVIKSVQLIASSRNFNFYCCVISSRICFFNFKPDNRNH